MSKKTTLDIPLWESAENRNGDYRTRQVFEADVKKLKKIISYVESRMEQDDTNLGKNPSVLVVGQPREDVDKWASGTLTEDDFSEDPEVWFIDHLIDQYEDVEPGDRVLLQEFDAFPSRMELDTTVTSPVSPNGYAGSSLVDREEVE